MSQGVSGVSDSDDEEILVSDDEKRKLKQVFDKLAKGGESISVDEGLILIKNISEDFSVAEEDLYEMLGDGEDS